MTVMVPGRGPVRVSAPSRFFSVCFSSGLPHARQVLREVHPQPLGQQAGHARLCPGGADGHTDRLGLGAAVLQRDEPQLSLQDFGADIQLLGQRHMAATADQALDQLQ